MSNLFSLIVFLLFNFLRLVQDLQTQVLSSLQQQLANINV